MIYIIEIPHQLPPRVWVAANEREVIETILEVSSISDSGPRSANFDDCLEWNGHDLKCQRVYMTDDEAKAALANDSEWRRIHQGIQARIALEEVIS